MNDSQTRSESFGLDVSARDGDVQVYAQSADYSGGQMHRLGAVTALALVVDRRFQYGSCMERKEQCRRFSSLDGSCPHQVSAGQREAVHFFRQGDHDPVCALIWAHVERMQAA